MSDARAGHDNARMVMTRNVALTLCLAVVGFGAACSTNPESSPVAPSALASDSTSESSAAARASTDRRDLPPLVSLRGTIRDLNDRHTQFVLVVQGDTDPPRHVQVRLDERTVIVFDGHFVRRSALQNGMECNVEGVLRDDVLLARKITLARAPAERGRRGGAGVYFTKKFPPGPIFNVELNDLDLGLEDRRLGWWTLR